MKKIITALLCLFCASYNTSLAQVILQDSLALTDIYRSTGGNNWILKTNWNSSLPVSQWHGVKVENRRVVELQFGEGNNLKDSIPASIDDLSALRVLNLNYNYISYLPPEINRLVLLRSLMLRSNQLSSLPENLSGMGALEELDVYSNYLTALPASLGSLQNLKVVSAGLNDLSDIPSSFSNHGTLRYLNLSRNRFTKFPDVITTLKALSVLIFNENPVHVLPADISRLDSLSVLQLKDNNLSAIPDEVGMLNNLRELSLQQNQIGSLPASVGNLKLLESLDIRYNHLKKLPEEICDLKNLKILIAEYNFLVSLPAGFGKLSNLVQLNIRFNNIDSLPPGFGNLKKLEELNLEGNLFRNKIPGELENLSGLTLISLRGNLFSKADPELFHNIPALKWVFLENNLMEELPDFSRNANLSDLSIYNNNLTFEDIAPLLKSKNLHLFYTPQDSTELDADTNMQPGFSVVLKAGAEWPGNKYTWFKDGEQIAVTDSAELFLKEEFIKEPGQFYCLISNSSIPDLILNSRVYYCSGTPLTRMSTDKNNIPSEFKLMQNYPNPFNPSTVISFSLPEARHVKLKIYNVDGREVRTLLDEFAPAGNKMISWDGKNNSGQDVSSGIYLYRIESEKFNQTRRMIKLK